MDSVIHEHFPKSQLVVEEFNTVKRKENLKSFENLSSTEKEEAKSLCS